MGDGSQNPPLDAGLEIDGNEAGFDVIHVPIAGESPGTSDLVLTSGDDIDTEALTIAGKAVPAGVVFDVHNHAGIADIELAVVHVRAFTVAAGSTINVVGNRPLVIVVETTATINGVLDGSAGNVQPGPGGFTSGSGPGVGQAGMSNSTSDSGGGGGGYGVAGGRGGNGNSPFVPGGPGGVVYASTSNTQLIGGSGGGLGSPTCGQSKPAGAGGGAIQISGRDAIVIGPNGGIAVGGGGGGGGVLCSDAASGAGGGSGGTIVLQSPQVEHSGLLAANGGGGGGSGGFDGGDFRAGEDGEDGRFADIEASGGRGGGNVAGFDGGNGAFGASPAEPGQNASAGNGGGGGGGTGFILVVTEQDGFANNGTTSPPPTELIEG